MTTALISENNHLSGITSETQRTPVGCDIVIEKLFGIPQDIEECRVLFLCGASAYRTSFRPVESTGNIHNHSCLDITSAELRDGRYLGNVAIYTQGQTWISILEQLQSAYRQSACLTVGV